MTDATVATDLALTIQRDFDAPREAVFAAWTEPEQLTAWLGPHGYRAHSVEGDLRPGGDWRSAIRGDDGADLWSSGTYREIVPAERLVFTFGWEETEGSREHDSLITITFEDLGNDRSRMTFSQERFESPASRDGHHSGWTEAFDKLLAHVER